MTKLDLMPLIDYFMDAIQSIEKKSQDATPFKDFLRKIMDFEEYFNEQMELLGDLLKAWNSYEKGDSSIMPYLKEYQKVMESIA